jgi:predicted GIY-YIG superfamily endonuclease
LKPSAKRGLVACAGALAKVDRPSGSSYGWQGSLVMFYVYLLKSQSPLKRLYVRSTRDPRQRVRDDNEGRCRRTAKFRPWILIACFAILHERIAIAFEKYHESGSGRPFINRYFL